MFVQFLKSLGLPLVIITVVFSVALTQPATAAPPDESARVNKSVAQTAGVTLEKTAITDTVPLGHPVTYTITIKNEGKEAINPTLTDALPQVPEGLGLQTHSLTATVGAISAENNVVTWSGSVPAGKVVTIHYSAIPPSTSQPGRVLTNTAKLAFGSTTLEASATITTQTPTLGLWGTFVNLVAMALVYLDTLLQSLHVPYAFGFAIVLFTVTVRLLTFPLNMQQIKSSKAMQELQPKMRELQEKYKNDKEKLAQAQMALYKEAGVNPLGGCLPMLVQMPIWFALYQSLVQLSHEGLLNEGFFWIPSLAGPVTFANGGLGWLWPLPPAVGWGSAAAYLVLPVLLVVSQFYMQQMMTPTSSDPQQASMNSMMKIMPLMFGYFSLVVPSGLTLYWFTSNILAMAQQYFTQTNLNLATTPAETALSAPVVASPITTNSEEDQQENDVKTKRKSRRKR